MARSRFPVPPSATPGIPLGEPSDPGPFVIRVKVPLDVTLVPQRHSEDGIDLVKSGVSHRARSRFGDEELQAYPPDAVIVLPAVVPPFRRANPVQPSPGLGDGHHDTCLQYLGPTDDPQKERWMLSGRDGDAPMRR